MFSRLDVYHHFGDASLLKLLLEQGEQIMATQQETAAQLQGLKDQLVKATGEIKGKIQALVDAAANSPNTDPALQQAVDDLKPISQALDDIVADANQPPATT